MSLSFDALPWFIQQKIAEKMEFTDFVTFQGTSKEALSTANRVKSRFLLQKKLSNAAHFGKTDEETTCRIRSDLGSTKKCFKLSEAPRIRFQAETIYIDAPLDEFICQSLVEFFEKSESTASELQMDEEFGTYVASSPDSLQKLLKIAKINVIIIQNGSITPETFQKIPETVKEVNCAALLEDKDLLSTKVEKLRITGTLVSNGGINMFLKEWREGKRRFQKLHLTSVENFEMFEILKDFEYTESTDPRDYGFFRTYEVQNGADLLDICLGTSAEDRSLDIRVKENTRQMEDQEDPMDYEEDVEMDEEEMEF